MRQVHEALLVALRPDSLQEDAYGADAMAQYDMLAQAANTEDASSAGTGAGVAPAAETANPPGAGSPPDTGGPPGKQASPKPNPASSAYFVRALKASAGGLHIEGLSSSPAPALRSYIARQKRNH